jgi:hypothetical protein
MGLLVFKSETLPLEVLREAAVMLNWKKRTVTPAGGESVTVRLTGTPYGVEPPSADEGFVDCPLQPDISKMDPAIMRNRATARIFPS